MKPPRSLPCTTAPTIAGYEVEEHLGLVAASLYDHTWRGADLSEHTVRVLSELAAERGANAVIAVRLTASAAGDHDSITTQLYAVGTAVRVSPEPPLLHPPIFAHELDERVLVEEAFAKADRDGDPRESSIPRHWWPLAGGLARAVVDGRLRHAVHEPERHSSEFTAFIRAVPHASAVSAVLPRYKTAAPDQHRWFQHLIHEAALGDHATAEEWLQDPDFETQKKALVVLRASKPTYGPSDIAELRRLSDLVHTTFDPERTRRPTRVEPVPRYHVSELERTQVVYVCACGRSFGMSTDGHGRCGRCRRDEHGFREYEPRAESVLSILSMRASALARAFEGESGGGERGPS